ncbi:unnamed protein product, partial [Ectocarpus sp. 6 AP-2014]
SRQHVEGTIASNVAVVQFSFFGEGWSWKNVSSINSQRHVYLLPLLAAYFVYTSLLFSGFLTQMLGQLVVLPII